MRAPVAILAAVEDEFDREDMLLSPEDFLRSPAFDLPDTARRRLLDLLDMYGLRVALDADRQGARGASAILQALAQRSGVRTATFTDRRAVRAAGHDVEGTRRDVRSAAHLVSAH